MSSPFDKRLWLPLAFLFALTAAQARPGQKGSETIATKPPTQHGVIVRMGGVDNDALKEDLKKSSRALQGHLRPDASFRQIRWQAEQDRERMLSVLETYGHFSADVIVAVETTTTPPEILFNITPGPLFHLEKTTAVFEDQSRSDIPSVSEERRPPAARAKTILLLEKRFIQELQNRGFPGANVVKRRLRIRKENEQVDLEVVVYRGIQTRFGAVEIEGLSTVRRSIIPPFIPWQEGDVFDVAAVRTLESTLLNKGLFSSVQCQPDGPVSGDGLQPMRLRLSERKHRTLRLGAQYSSDVGVGASIAWEHRNVRGYGDRLTLDAEITEIGTEGLIRFRQDKLKHLPLTLETSVEFGDEETDAYDNYATEARTLYGYQIRPHLRLITGLGYRNTEVEQLERTDHFELLLAPILLDWDRRDDLIDPRKGFHLLGGATWHKDILSDLAFRTTRLAGSAYYTPSSLPRITWALRLEAAAIQGAVRDDVPADSRLYAGGASSVRGYAFQSIGTRVDDTPLGGTRRVTGSAELRLRTSGSWGGVLFTDSGSIAHGRPEEDTLRHSVGMGLRYATDIGPLRLDLAFPLSPREGIDDDVQLYVSIGQYF